MVKMMNCKNKRITRTYQVNKQGKTVERKIKVKYKGLYNI
jgi:hypothetical protein